MTWSDSITHRRVRLVPVPRLVSYLALGLLSWRAAASFIAALFALLALSGAPLDITGTLTAISFALIFLIQKVVEGAKGVKVEYH